MGHPVVPLMLLLLWCVAPSSPCFTVSPEAPLKLNLANTSRQCAELDWGRFQRQSHVWLSHNGIEALSPSSRVQPGLEVLDLSYNRLRELPPAFLSQARGLRHLQLQHNRLRELPHGLFANAVALQSLQLEGNPLLAVPPAAFQASLSILDLPCRCDAVGSVLASCACSRHNCTRCRCFTDRQVFNATDFHAQECRGSAGLVEGLAGATVGVVVLVVVVVVAVVWCRWRKVGAGVTGVGRSKREPTTAHVQPRYISRAAETGTAPDYENIFVSPCPVPAAARGWAPEWQQEQDSRQVPVDDDYFLESDAGPGDQPIYANTQTHSQDNIYIIPDQ
ncbi:leucine-rich repeat-containing protein 25 [Rhynochetos jubatus]